MYINSHKILNDWLLKAIGKVNKTSALQHWTCWVRHENIGYKSFLWYKILFFARFLATWKNLWNGLHRHLKRLGIYNFSAHNNKSACSRDNIHMFNNLRYLQNLPFLLLKLNMKLRFFSGKTIWKYQGSPCSINLDHLSAIKFYGTIGRYKLGLSTLLTCGNY